MGWQDELRELDDELSAGSVSEHDYRRRRDEILASASGNPALSRRVTKTPAKGAAQGTPQAVATEPEPDQPAGDAPDADPEAAAETQKVTVPPAGTWRSQSPGPAETSLYPPQRIHSPEGHDAPRPGAEIFTAGGAHKSPPRAVWIAVAVIAAVVAGIAFWWIASGSGDDDDAAPPPVAGPPAQTGLGVEKLPNPAKAPLSTSGVLSLAQAQEQKLVQADEVEYLTAADVRTVYYRSVVEGNLAYQLFAYETADPAKVVEGAGARGEKLGMVRQDVSGVADGVTVRKAVGGDAVLYEALYPTDGAAVRISILQNAPVDEAQLTVALRNAVDLAVKSLGVR